MEVDFYGQLPIILANILGYCEICNNKKLHLQTFFTQSTGFEVFKTKVIFLMKTSPQRQTKKNLIQETIIQKKHVVLKGISIFQKDSLWHIRGEVERYIINFEEKNCSHPAT